MPGRHYQAASTNKHRFGFNGKEADNEINVNGGSYDFAARIYDGRLGRWLSLDPLQSHYPNLTPYCGFGNNPIFYIDDDGRKITPTKSFSGSTYNVVLQLMLAQRNTEFMKLYGLFDGKDDPNLNLDYKNLEGANKNSGAITSTSGGAYFIDFNQRAMEFATGEEMFKDAGRLQYKHLSDAGIVVYTVHEFLHAKMRSEGLFSDKPANEVNGLDHEEIATKYRSTITAVLTEYNTKNRLGLKAKDIANLSWIGLEETKAFKTEFGDLDFNKLKEDNGERTYYNSLNEKQKGLIDSYEKSKYLVSRDAKGQSPKAYKKHSTSKNEPAKTVSPD